MSDDKYKITSSEVTINDQESVTQLYTLFRVAVFQSNMFHGLYCIEDAIINGEQCAVLCAGESTTDEQIGEAVVRYTKERGKKKIFMWKVIK